MKINTNTMVLIEDLKRTQSDDGELFKLAEEAKLFLESHKWCKKVEKQWLASGWENLLLVFYFKITPNSKNADDYVWVVVGDLPPAYIDIESADNISDVIETYTDLMDDWVQCVKNGQPVEDCYPIDVPPENEYAEMLAIRIKLVREYILKQSPSN